MERMQGEIKKLEAAIEKPRAEMKEVREIAESYYEAASPEVKSQANCFFNSMDRDGNEKVDLEEFLSFMRREGYSHMRNNSFFKMLDTNRNGTLTFMDVITLYYIIKSGRPFCDSCREFIPATFFSCVACFNHPNNSFHLCRRCHKSKNYNHSHDGRRPLFLDNYTLLQATATQPVQATQTEPTCSRSRRSASAQPPLLLGNGDSALTSTEYMTKELDRVLAQSRSQSQSQSQSRSLTRSRSRSLDRSLSITRNEATTSTPNTHLETRRDTLHRYAIVQATDHEAVSWKDIASASFKALDKMIIVANLVAAVSSAAACTIM